MGKFIRNILVLILFLFLFVGCLIHAANLIPKSSLRSVYNLKDIPQNDAQCLFKDSKGFIWIGTLDGLHRYDGYTYKTYRTNKSGNCICSNMIISIAEDTIGNIWIGTYGSGICKLNPVTDRFTSYNNKENEIESKIDNDIAKILVDHRNVIWLVGWFGVSRLELDEEMNNIVTVESILSQEIKSIVEDSNHQIWLGTNSQLLRIINPYDAPSKIEFETFQVNATAMCTYNRGVAVGGHGLSILLSDNTSPDLKYDDYYIFKYYENTNQYVTTLEYNNNTLWVGSRAGINCLERNEDTSWSITNSFSNNSTDQNIGGNIITALVADDYGQMWVGTRGGGVSTIRENPKKFELYKNTEHPGSISNNFTRSLYVDHSDNVWIGSEEGGVSFLRNSEENDYAKGFKHLQVNSGLSENRVYAITELMTPKSKKHKSLMFMGTSYPTNLATVDPNTLEVRSTSLGNATVGFVFALEVENDTTIWAGTYFNGLWKFITDEDGEIVKSYHFTPHSSYGSSITSFIIRSIFKDSKGNLWIGTDKGLNLIVADELKNEYPTIRKFNRGDQEHTLPYDYILQIFETQNGKIWMGSMGGGLIGVENSMDGVYSFSSVTVEDGLPNNSIKSIQEDAEGFLWLASNNGLSRFNPNTFEIANFDVEDGLQDNEFSEICSAVRKNGQLIFGGRQGFNVFYPNEILQDTIPPKMFFTEFSIFNQEVKPGDIINGRVVMEKTIEFTKSIKLKYKENNFSIGFVGVQYNSPQKNKYHYKLEGYDLDWIKAESDSRIAKYTNLDAGKYVFKVNAANSDGIWANQPLELTIIIEPPFWITWWFRLILFFVFVGALVLLYFYKLHAYKRQQRELETLVRSKTTELRNANEGLKELNATKDKFMSIIAHDIINPFNTILGFSELLAANFDSWSDKEKIKMVKQINGSSAKLFELLQNLLHWSKAERGLLVVQPEALDLNKMILETVSVLESTAQAKGIHLTTSLIENDTLVFTDVNLIRAIVRNLLSNAIKFTERGNKIEIKVVHRYSFANVSVIDQGVGISPDNLKNLFRLDVSHSTKGTNEEDGTGLGLILVKEFVEKQGGEFWIESKVGAGSTFTFSVPLLHTDVHSSNS